MEILKLKNTRTEIFLKITRRDEQQTWSRRISEFEDSSFEIIKSEEQKEKWTKVKKTKGLGRYNQRD